MSGRKQRAPSRLQVTNEVEARARGCLNKRTYDREVQARKAARLTGDNCKPYKCQFCPGFHVGRDRRNLPK